MYVERSVPAAEERREVGVVEEQRALGEQQADVYCTGSTLPTRSCSCDEVEESTRSSRVVHGVNGSHDGRTSMPASRSRSHRARGIGRGVSLVEDLQDVVVDRLERGHHEHAAGGGQLGPESAWRSTCSTLTVQSKVRSGKRSCIAADDAA